MGRIRISIEIAAALFLLIAVAVTLNWYGKSRRTFLPAAGIFEIAGPSEAFRVWDKNRIHGRVLVLFDRQLNADPHYHEFFFSADEFHSGFRVETLYDAVIRDLPELRDISAGRRLEGLNRLIETVDLSSRFEGMRQGKPPKDLELLRTRAKRAMWLGSNAAKWDKRALVTLNRWALEDRYAGICPRKGRYIVRPDNYVFQALQAGMVRAVYHVVPDAAWAEVERNLAGYPLVSRSHSGYRFPGDEGTPVSIMRSRDLPAFDEPVLVNINGDPWREDGIEALLRPLQDRRLRPDVITVAGAGAEALSMRIREMMDRAGPQ